MERSAGGCERQNKRKKLQKTDTAVAKLFTKLAGVTTASYLWVETKYHEKQKRSISYKDNG